MSAQADRPSVACVTSPTDLMKRFFDWFNNLYPVWLVTLAIIAFFKPPVMLWFNSDWVFWSLAASMLGMGLTLSLDDFKAIGRMPGCVALGFIAQYTIMPLAGWATAKFVGLEPGLPVGRILGAGGQSHPDHQPDDRRHRKCCIRDRAVCVPRVQMSRSCSTRSSGRHLASAALLSPRLDVSCLARPMTSARPARP